MRKVLHGYGIRSSSATDQPLRRSLTTREILLNALATAGLLIGLPLLAIGIADWVRWN